MAMNPRLLRPVVPRPTLPAVMRTQDNKVLTTQSGQDVRTVQGA